MAQPAPTFVVELTPAGRGAVAVVLVAGPEAIRKVGAFFEPASSRPLQAAEPGRLLFGRWGGPGGEELIVCRRAADELEVHCHGGEAAVNAVITSLAERGCQRITWQEWLKEQSFDAPRRAALAALANATTGRTAAVLLDQFHGALSEAARAAGAAVAAGDWQSAAEILNGVLRHRDVGLHLTTTWQVVLAGPPNVGKSSLLNAIAGYQRAIVSPHPGTTRDVVTLTTAIDGWPVEFADTAGLRAGRDELEAAGIKLAEAAAAVADLVVAVQDATQAPGPETPWPTGMRLIHVVNKIDLLPGAGAGGNWPRDAITTSAATGAGIAELLAKISHTLVPAAPPAGAAVPFTGEQAETIARALAAIDVPDMAAARRALQSLLAD